jgi:hypothetical protein
MSGLMISILIVVSPHRSRINEEKLLLAQSELAHDVQREYANSYFPDEGMTEYDKGVGKQCFVSSTRPTVAARQANPVLTRDGELFRLDGVPIHRFGIRVVNALQSDEITQRLIDNLDLMRDHGIQSISVNVQGGRATQGGNSNFNGYNADGSLKSEYIDRLADILDATAERDMVVAIQMFYRGKDQELTNDAAVLTAVENTVNWLEAGGWNHYWLHVINEWYHSGYVHNQLKTSQGQVEIYSLIKSINSEIITHVSSANGANDGFAADTGRTASNGDVVIEYVRQDQYDQPGEFTSQERSEAIAKATETFNSGGYWFWHAAWHQKADAPGWPRFDKGGAGTTADPGVTFIWDHMGALTLPVAAYLPVVNAP